MNCWMCGKPIQNPKRNQVYCLGCARINLKRIKGQQCGVFKTGQRGAEARDLEKYYGKALLLRRMRILKYEIAVAQRQPIPYERRFSMRSA